MRSNDIIQKVGKKREMKEEKRKNRFGGWSFVRE